MGGPRLPAPSVKRGDVLREECFFCSWEGFDEFEVRGGFQFERNGRRERG